MFKSKILKNLFGLHASSEQPAESGDRLDRAAHATDLSGNPRWPTKIGYALLLVGLGGFVTWAALAPLDEGVPAPGSIVIESQRKPVQHLTGGIVRKVHVSEAQQVEAGTVLVELDDTQLRADLEAIKSRLYGGIALEARLMAERTHASHIEFPPEFVALTVHEPQALRNMNLQEQLFFSRQAALQSELRSIDQAISSLGSQQLGLRARLSGRRIQLALLEEQLKGSRGLAAEGYLPRNQLLEEERLGADLYSQTIDLESSIAASHSDIAELRLRRETRMREFLQQVDAELAEVAREVPAFREKLASLATEISRTRLTSPVKGIVVGLQVQSVNAVVAPGSKMMDIVPTNERLILEVRIEPQLIDRLHPGLLADVRFNAFQSSPDTLVEGRLISVSADRLTDPVSNMPYFLGRIEVLPESLGKLKDKQVIPGMSADAVIKTGERSLLDYMVRPLIRRVSTSMTEY
ncbi:MAG: HlyD family type I secretion periplasmic adaptor subunit [Thiobacillus sp.]|nr:HlyD family type I secretion periplasmic adaptor subunit [Thiobacillus sp.]